ncbi:MAG: site-specific integrase [Dehalococcoidia bacterium]|nr:site-specific integrase [Dehalococcoidia bacterium]
MADATRHQHQWHKQDGRTICRECGRERALKGSGSVIERGNTYQAQIRIRGETFLQGGFNSRLDAKRWLDETRLEHRSGRLVRPTNINVGQWLREWLELNGGDRQWKPTTRNGYQRIVELYLIPAFGRRYLHALDSIDIQRQFRKWEQEGLPVQRGKKARIPSAGRLLNVYRCLNKALADAAYHRRIGSNPMERMRPPRPERERPNMWSVKETQHFIASSRESRYAPLYALLLGTGCRSGEALALTWDDVDLTADQVSINKSVAIIGGKEVTSRPKTRAGTRRVRLPAFTREALRAWKARQAEELLKLRPRPEHGRVFTNPSGSPLRSSQVRRTFLADMKAAELPTLRLHDLRHTAASVMLAQGTPIPVVSAMLGHANSNVTMGVYAHMLKDDDRLAVEAMDRVFGS